MLSPDESDSPDDKSNYGGSDSGSAGTCAFSFRFEYSIGCVEDSDGCVDDSVGCVRGVGYGFFVLTGIESIGDVVLLVVFIPIRVYSKGG